MGLHCTSINEIPGLLKITELFTGTLWLSGFYAEDS